MIREIINLSLLNAFRVDPADVAYPLYLRLPGKRLALLHWGPSVIKISFATKTDRGMEVAPEELSLPVMTPIEEVCETLKQRTDCNCVAVLYSAMNLYCEAQNGPRAEKGEMLEAKLRSDPKSLIGSVYEEEKVYQILMAPDRQTRILFAVNKAPYMELEKGLKDHGLTIVRSQLAPYALLNAMFGDKGWSGEDPKIQEEFIVLGTVVSQAHVIVFDYDNERFSPEVFRATPLFLDKNSSPETIEQIRVFFANCAEAAVIAKRVFGKKVLFKWTVSGNLSETTLELGGYLQDRSDIEFGKWDKMEPNLDFKALVQS
jgi:hypothetical protein